jgi:putative methionine-R-sulfoxide reductase with GAF domain
VSHGNLIGVLDIDSPVTRRFSEADQIGVELLCESFCTLQEARKYFI